MTTSELQTVQRIIAGDTAATEQFVQDHYQAVYRLLLRLTRQREEAEDLTQHTFIVIRRSLGTFRGASTLRSWIHRIAMNEYRQWRRKQRWTAILDREKPSQFDDLKAFEDGYVLSQAMSLLSDKLREAFILFEVEQLSMDEVAQVLGIPSGTAKARVATARQRLRSILEEQNEVKTHEFRESTP